MGVLSPVMEELSLVHFLAAVQLLMCELVLDQCCRGFMWFMWCKQLLAARTRRMPAVADQSYTFVVLLVDTIMGVRLRESEAWTNSTPMLLALRAVSDGGRQAIDECGPVNGHATATSHYFGPIGLARARAAMRKQKSGRVKNHNAETIYPVLGFSWRDTSACKS